MSILGLLSLLFAFIAALLLVLYALQRRDVRGLAQLSQELQRISGGGKLPGRIEVESDKPERIKVVMRRATARALSAAR